MSYNGKPDKTARPPRGRLSVEGVAEAIERYFGNLASVARAFGVSRMAVWSFVERRPELQEILRDARETLLDNAESALDRAIVRGEPWAIKLILKTLGKSRGYVERCEMAH